MAEGPERPTESGRFGEGMTATRVELRAGDVLFTEGDPPTCAYLIESGTLRVSTVKAGEIVVLGRVSSGDLLGEMAVIDDSPRTASVVAETFCVLTSLDRTQLHERIENADPIVRGILRGQLHRYRTALAKFRGEADPPAPSPGVPNGEVDNLDRRAIGKIRLEAQLREALERRELELRYQPIFDIPLGRVTGYEALIRWTHPERGPVSPMEFIALAEETSLIVPVGRYVLEETCLALGELRRRGVDELPFISINVSGRQLEEPDWLDDVERYTASNGISPSTLKIEITESLTLDVDAVARLIDRCHGIGMKVSLDDFGTGHSNLGHLHKSEFDTIKLDQGFTRQMLDAPRCLAIVRAIVEMVRALDADLVAEGVETQDQLDALRIMGCRYAQGYLIGRPMARDDMFSAHQA